MIALNRVPWLLLFSLTKSEKKEHFAFLINSVQWFFNDLNLLKSAVFFVVRHFRSAFLLSFVTNPTPTLTPNRNPNSNPNQINEKIQKETSLEIDQIT